MPYQKINWQNGPAGGTPVNKTNLNRMDSQIAKNEADIEDLKTRPTGGASLILTGQRRLTTSEAGKIAGLDVKGKSEQEATQPTPDNPIPIVNASGVIQAHSKNIWNFDGIKPIANATYNDGVLSLSWDAGFSCDLLSNGSKTIPLDASKSYALSMDVKGQGISVRIDASGARVIDTNASTSWTRYSTIISGKSEMFIQIIRRDTSGSAQVKNIQVEEGATATAYEPYASNQIDLSAYDLRSAGSIADELIVYPDKTGKLIQRVIERDLASLEWAYNGTTKIFVCAEDLGALAINGVTMACNIYKAVDNVGGVADAYNRGNNTICGFNSYANTRLYIRNDDCKTAEELQATFTDSVFIYALKTPIETPLTADQVAEILALETYAPETIIETELDLQGVDYLGDVKGYIDSFNVYSTEETICGYEEDGTPRYRRKIYGTTPATASRNAKVSDVISGQRCVFKSVNGSIRFSDTVVFPINYFLGTSNYSMVFLDADGLYMNVATVTSKPCEIDVEYIYKDGATPAAASVMALTDDDTQTTGDEIILPEPETYIDDTVVYGGN